jgi:phosphatidylserine/phosphatidylglycerophosphate/cardiolipin synthase-like enzyme
MQIKKNNFYFKSQNNKNESIEVYVGQSSGKQLNSDILNAKNEVLIVSPYIDESKLDDLIRLKDRGVNVRLAFSDLRTNQKSNILRKLVSQKRYTDEKFKEELLKKRKIFTILSFSFLVLGFISLFFSVLNFEKFDLVTISTFIITLLCFYGFYKIDSKKKDLAKTNIYRYEYLKKINFKYLRNNFRSHDSMFIHSKIYVIDREIAYIGSMNYTNNGFTSNFETRVRITQLEKLKELAAFIHNIFDDEYNFKSHEIAFLGKQVYSEEN